MCGICGAVGYQGKANRKRILSDMMKAIRHRGPDAGNFYMSEDAMLGFQRLSIIDHETGMQPMFNEDRSVALVFNGEIYNYKRLMELLTTKEHRFFSVCDSEVLVHGYEEYKQDILYKLRGMFSFAIWEQEEKRLFAARDYFGIKPFYYTRIGNTFVFASEIKSILEFPGYHPEVNEEALEQYLSFQYSVLPETFFRGIYQLLPGHYLIYQNGKLETESYFAPNLKPVRTENGKNLKENIQMTLLDSVKNHLNSDVEVGSFLSGGVDSSLIAAMSGCRKTFTVGFSDVGERYDETGYAKKTADDLRIENYCRYIGKKEFFSAVPKVMYYMDEPSGDASAVALYFLAAQASDHVKVVLSGEGADEIFGGYNIYLEPKAMKMTDWIPPVIRKKLAKAAKDILPDHIKGKNYLIRAGLELSERYIGNAYIFHEEEKKKLLIRNIPSGGPENLLKADYQKLAHLKNSDQMQSIDLKYWLPGDILQKADKMSMAHSLELRVPFLDKYVFRAARRIPYRMKTMHYTTKYVLRKVAELYLPKKSSRRKKLGFPIPIRNWIRDDDWYCHMKELFTGASSSRYFHTEYLVKLLEEHRAGTEDNSRKIWTVYAFLIWHQVYFENKDYED